MTNECEELGNVGVNDQSAGVQEGRRRIDAREEPAKIRELVMISKSAAVNAAAQLDPQRQAILHFLLGLLSLAPETQSAFADPEEAQAIPEDAQNAEVAKEYGVTGRKADADENDACNNAFHSS